MILMIVLMIIIMIMKNQYLYYLLDQNISNSNFIIIVFKNKRFLSNLIINTILIIMIAN